MRRWLAMLLPALLGVGIPLAAAPVLLQLPPIEEQAPVQAPPAPRRAVPQIKPAQFAPPPAEPVALIDPPPLPPLAPMPPAVALAHQDAAKITDDYRHDVRYLRLDDVADRDALDLWLKVLTVHLNSLSDSSDLVPPVAVAGSDGRLLRINATDYGKAFAASWEKLVSPYDTQVVQAVEIVSDVTVYGYEHPATREWVEIGRDKPAGKYGYNDTTTGKWVDTPIIAKVTPGRSTKGTKRVEPAFWLTEADDLKPNPKLQAQFAELVHWLGDTRAPIVRARWFLSQTAIQADRVPGYYDFLGIKDEKTFQDLGGHDAKRKSRRIEFREAVAISGVTLQPRAIVRKTGDDVPYWVSFDFRKALDKLNPLRVFGQGIEDAYRDPKVVAEVASEQYIGLPNDLWATGLFNNAGVRQDSAPDFIASDSRTTSNDARVHVNLGCLRCHDQGGLKSIDGWARNFFPPPLELKLQDYHDAQLFRQQYGRDLAARIDQDRGPYTRAIKSLTGWDTKEFSAAYGRAWREYEDAGIDLQRAAADLGTTPPALLKALRLTIAAGRADTVLSVLTLEGDRARKIPVRQWEEVQAIAHLALRGLQAAEVK